MHLFITPIIQDQTRPNVILVNISILPQLEKNTFTTIHHLYSSNDIDLQGNIKAISQSDTM